MKTDNELIAEKRICKCGCGRILRPNYKRALVPSKGLPSLLIEKGIILSIDGYGYMNNGFFYNQTCAYRFAVNYFRKQSLKQ